MIISTGTDYNLRCTDTISVSQPQYDSVTVTSVTYTIYNTRNYIDTALLAQIERLGKIQMIRSGWNNPPIIGRQSKPILPNLKTVIRNQLPRKIRAD